MEVGVESGQEKAAAEEASAVVAVHATAVAIRRLQQSGERTSRRSATAVGRPPPHDRLRHGLARLRPKNGMKLCVNDRPKSMDYACFAALIMNVPPAWFPCVAKSVLAGVIGLLLFSRVPADIVMLTGVTELLLTGVISEGQAFEGFANSQVITIGVLFIVGEGVCNTGGVAWIAE